MQLVSEAPHGLAIQEVADRLGIHRTMASRLLATLEQSRLVARHGGRFRTGAQLAVLGAQFDHHLQDLAMPVLRDLADATAATASLLVAERDEQVAVAVIVPNGVSHHLSFRVGSRYPIDRGAAGIALLAGGRPRPGEREAVAQAREQGWILTHGEVEPGAYALAVPVVRSAPSPPTAINLVSHRADVLEDARPAVIAAAGRLAAILA